jgi:hypothetical protein
MSKGKLLMLDAFQKHAYGNDLSVDDIKVWLLRESSYNKTNLEILTRWQETRYKREYLTNKQIAEWYEFYFC